MRLAVVTGTSKGIGKAIAKDLSREGLHVLATSRDPKLGAKTAEELGLPFLALDVADAASVETFAEELAKTLGEDGLDVLVNNAGIALDGFDADIARRTMEVNFHGAVRVTDRLLPMLRPGARVVMVSSGMGELSCIAGPLRKQLASPELRREELMDIARRFVDEVAAGTHTKSGFPSSAYRVSKVCLNAYVRVLARELEGDPRKILVNAACPGWVRTAMGGRGAPRSPEQGAKTPIWLATLPEGGPTGGFFRDEAPAAW
jgi:NAD(P)-dependent dehydrogenase (short-subunit alcohol dehydrogenase family)